MEDSLGLAGCVEYVVCQVWMPGMMVGMMLFQVLLFFVSFSVSLTLARFTICCVGLLCPVTVLLCCATVY